MIHKRFNSEEVNQSSSKKTVKVTYYATTFSELEDFISANFPEGRDSEIGEVTQNHFYRTGNTWYCDVTGEFDLAPNGLVIHYNNRKEQAKPQKHSLCTVCIPLELNRLDNYRTHWDHYLWAAADSLDAVIAVPSPALEATTSCRFYTGETCFAWTRQNQPPGEPLESGKYWIAVKSPSKPGVKTVEYFTYQITESGEYNSESAAYWAVKEILNGVQTKPLLGTMGVSGNGNWKLNHASIRHNGKVWLAECIWTFLPGGWDPDLYPPMVNDLT